MTNAQSNDDDDQSIKTDENAAGTYDAAHSSDDTTDAEEVNRSLTDLPLSRRTTLAVSSALAAAAGASGSASATEVSSNNQFSGPEVVLPSDETEVLRLDLESDDEILDITGGTGPAGDNPGNTEEDYDAVDSDHPQPSVDQEVIPGDRVNEFLIQDRVFSTTYFDFDLDSDGLFQSAGSVTDDQGNGTQTEFVAEFVPFGYAASDGSGGSDVRSDPTGFTLTGVPEAEPPTGTGFSTDLSTVINPQLSVKVDSIGIGQEQVVANMSGVSFPYTAQDVESNISSGGPNLGDVSGASGDAVLVTSGGNVPDFHSSDANGYTVVYDGGSDQVTINFNEHRTDVTLPNAGFITEVQTDTIPSEAALPGSGFPGSGAGSGTSGLTDASSIGLQDDFRAGLQPGQFVEYREDDELLIADEFEANEPQLSNQTGFVSVTAVNDFDNITGDTLAGLRVDDSSDPVFNVAQRVDPRSTTPPVQVDSLDSSSNGYIHLPVNADAFPQNAVGRGEGIVVGSDNQDSPRGSDAQGLLSLGDIGNANQVNDQAAATQLTQRSGSDAGASVSIDSETQLPQPVADREGLITADLAARKLDFDATALVSADVNIAGQATVPGGLNNPATGNTPDAVALSPGRQTPVQIHVRGRFGGAGSNVDGIANGVGLAGSDTFGDITRDPRVQFRINAGLSSISSGQIDSSVTDNGVFIPASGDDGETIAVDVNIDQTGDNPDAPGSPATTRETVEIFVANGDSTSPNAAGNVFEFVRQTSSTTGEILRAGEPVQLAVTEEFSGIPDGSGGTATAEVDVTRRSGTRFSSDDTTAIAVGNPDAGTADDNDGTRTTTPSFAGYIQAQNTTNSSPLSSASINITTPNNSPGSVQFDINPEYFLEAVGQTNSEIYDRDNNLNEVREVTDKLADPSTVNEATIDPIQLDTGPKIAAALEQAINNNLSGRSASVTVVFNPSSITDHSASGYVVLSDAPVESAFDQNVDQSSVEIREFDPLVVGSGGVLDNGRGIIDPNDFNSENGIQQLSDLERQNVAQALGFDDEPFNEVDALVVNNGNSDHVYEPRSDPLNEVTQDTDDNNTEFLGDNQLTCTLDGTVNRELGPDEDPVDAVTSITAGEDFGASLDLVGGQDRTGTSSLHTDDENSLVYHQSESVDGEGFGGPVSAADNANDNKVAVHNDALDRYQAVRSFNPNGYPPFVEAFDILEMKDSIATVGGGISDRNAGGRKAGPPGRFGRTPGTQVRDSDVRPLDERDTCVDAFYGDRFDGLAVRNDASTNAADYENIAEHRILADPDDERDFIIADQELSIEGNSVLVSFPGDRPDVVAFKGQTLVSSATFDVFTDERGDEIYFGTNSATTCDIAVEDNVELAVRAATTQDISDGDVLDYKVPELYDQDTNGIADGEYTPIRDSASGPDASDQDRGIFFESHDDQGDISAAQQIEIGTPVGGGSSNPAENYDPTGSSDVSADGLLTAIDDWRNGQLDTLDLTDVIDAWRNT